MSEERTSKLMLWILAELENEPYSRTIPELTRRRLKQVCGKEWDKAQWREQDSAVEVRTTVIARSLKRLLKRERVFKAGIGNTIYWFLPTHANAFLKRHLQMFRWKLEDTRKRYCRLIEQEDALDELMNCKASSQSIRESGRKEQTRAVGTGGQQ